MKKANLHEAKTTLSKLIEAVLAGEEVIICKAGIPIAKLIAFSDAGRPRKPGALQGKIKIAEDFDEMPEEF